MSSLTQAPVLLVITLFALHKGLRTLSTWHQVCSVIPVSYLSCYQVRLVFEYDCRKIISGFGRGSPSLKMLAFIIFISEFYWIVITVNTELDSPS